ncbi:regulator of microtubule dynamics protein 1-like isoform X1 [Spodoptera litura]|uniref:Regulator of microtubule dynamics protein 1 n=2 Tax=Spodoptera litura TaxID=69820 RepID=A0A9J7IN89_SPOLT|nr:regulator of microtubule dynamics protein 1-like isoform X1 [Spodoptera litura]
MNNFYKLRPVSYKVFQRIINYGKMNITSNAKIIHQDISLPNKIIMLSTTLSFMLWPIKSKDPAEKSAAQHVLPIDDADKLFENGHYEECYKLLAEHQDKGNVEVQWRICRALYNMSKESKYDKQYKNNLVCQAYDLILKVLNDTQDHYAVHKWYALLLDAKSSLDGIKERIRQLENVKRHMDMAVTLNPNDATILHMLGEWCYQIAEMPWHHRKIAEVLFASPPYSTYEEALEYFLKAEAVQPRFYSINLLRLGNCYLKLKKEDQAKYYLQLAASYPAKSNDDHKANTEAAELLKKLK